MQDLRLAARVLAKSPGFTALAVIVLALGIGANSAIFSVVDAVLLRPLPFGQPDRLVMLWERSPSSPHTHTAPLNFLDWHDRNSAFETLAGIAGGSRTLTTSAGAERIAGQAVTLDFFQLLRVPPLAGRSFTTKDSRTRADVVVISERLWRNQLHSDAAIVGKTIPLDSKPYTVIGIVPAHLQILYPADLWTLMTPLRSPEQRRMHYYQVLGRLKPGVSLEQAKSSMGALAAQIAEAAPETNKGWGVTIEPLRQAMVGAELRTTSLVLAALVLLILLMACANVASLLLSRGASRTREMAVRTALGAGGVRLIRQSLTESLLLGILGGAAGLALGWLLLRVAPYIVPPGSLPAGIVLQLDARVTAFTALVSLATGLLFGLAPALQSARNYPIDAIRGGRTVSGGNTRLLGLLAGIEIAIAVMVVSGAGLFLRTLDRLTRVDPGYHADRVLTMHVSLPLSRYPKPADALVFYQAAIPALENLPGVRSASFGGALPLTGFNIGQGVQIVGETQPEESRALSTHYQIVGARYFETLGIPLEAGRTFAPRDDSSAPQVAIVNREFVRKYLDGKPAVGTRIRVHAMDPAGPRYVEREIVGVAGQVKVDGLNEPEGTVEVYVPITQNPWYGASIALRTAGDPLALTAAVKSVIAKYDRQLALIDIRTMQSIADSSVANPRFRARLVAGFAALALGLSAVGIFGVLAFSVTQRRREFGIRMALGARLGDVLSLVIARGVKIAAAGIVAGLLGAAAPTHTLAALLFGVNPLDALTFTAASTILGTVALAAATIPAYRAAKVDPAIALRDE